jgi:hypothetical protein
MLKNPNIKIATPVSSHSLTVSSQQQTNTQLVIVRLCTKIAALNNLNDKDKEEFIDSSYRFMLKTFCSDAYSPAYESFEISQKIKRQCKTNFNFKKK